MCVQTYRQSSKHACLYKHTHSQVNMHACIKTYRQSSRQECLYKHTETISETDNLQFRIRIKKSFILSMNILNFGVCLETFF